MAHELYRHFDRAGALLYVGISLSSIQRLRQHRCHAPWFPRIATVNIEHFENQALALTAEARAIQVEQPLFNRRGVGMDESNPAPVITYDEAVNAFKGPDGDSRGAASRLAKVLGVSRPSVSEWKEDGVLPEGRVWQLITQRPDKFGHLQPKEARAA